jgi:hypothetical protein
MRLTPRLLKLWAAGSSETSVQLYTTVRPYNTSETNLNAFRSLRLKYRKLSVHRLVWEAKLQKHATKHKFTAFYCLTDGKRSEFEAKQYPVNK